MKMYLSKALLLVAAGAFCTAGAWKYQADVINNLGRRVLAQIRIDSQTTDGSGFFVSQWLAPGEESILVAEEAALKAQWTHPQEKGIIDAANKKVTLYVGCDMGMLSPEPELTADPATVPVFTITESNGKLVATAGTAQKSASPLK